DLDVRLGGQDHLEAAAEQGVVVRDQDTERVWGLSPFGIHRSHPVPPGTRPARGTELRLRRHAPRGRYAGILEDWPPEVTSFSASPDSRGPDVPGAPGADRGRRPCLPRSRWP